MTLLKKSSIYLAALAVSSLILFISFKFAILAGPILLFPGSHWMPLAGMIFLLAVVYRLKTRNSLQAKPLIVGRNLSK
jgi:hypothetical protein